MKKGLIVAAITMASYSTFAKYDVECKKYFLNASGLPSEINEYVPAYFEIKQSTFSIYVEGHEKPVRSVYVEVGEKEQLLEEEGHKFKVNKDVQFSQHADNKNVIHSKMTVKMTNFLGWYSKLAVKNKDKIYLDFSHRDPASNATHHGNEFLKIETTSHLPFEPKYQMLESLVSCRTKDLSNQSVLLVKKLVR